MAFKSGPLIEEHYILDTAGLWKVEYEYANTGVAEGWLVYVHGMRDYRDIMCHTYRYMKDDQ